jgi:hypothetical protein
MRALYCTRKVIWAVPVPPDARNKNLPFMRAIYCTRKVTRAAPIPPDARKCYFFPYLCTACRLQIAPETRCNSRPSSSSHFASRCGDQPSGSIHLSSRHPIYQVKEVTKILFHPLPPPPLPYTVVLDLGPTPRIGFFGLGSRDRSGNICRIRIPLSSLEDIEMDYQVE